MIYPLHISQRSYDYLLTQNGDLSHIDGMDDWVCSYQGKLRILLQQIEGVYPMPRHVLDIGSGLGGIDALLIKSCACTVAMIDGECAGPEVLQHDLPFCSRDAVQQFMVENHIDPASWSYHNPQDLPAGPFDLVLSFASWCFHYSPSKYLDYTLDVVDHAAIYILDVRRDRKDWVKELETKLTKLKVIQNGKKYDRVVYTTK
jgi:hypothetical protein